MRWKLLVFASIIAGLLSVTLWSMFAIIIFGSARVLAQEDWRLLCSLVIPIAIIAFASTFVYRHTSKRRKLQAFLAAMFTLVLTLVFYVVGSSVFVSRLYIPTTYEVRHAR
jgi:uncharacterized membrane protein